MAAGSSWGQDTTLTMNDSAQVNDNTASSYGGTRVGGTAEGGGILVAGDAGVSMNDAAEVQGNSATRSGGGVFNGGTLTLSGSARISGNTALTGGGIDNLGTFNACDTWTGAISPNNPDDPPTPNTIAC